MLTFHVLGTLELRDADGRPISGPIAGAKRLALLAHLTLGARGGLVRRDTLLGLLWPELDQSRARNALSNMLHQLRRAVGPGVLLPRGHDEVGVAPDALWCDALAFEAALADGRRAEALDLYRGDLLAGLFVPGASTEFEHWLDAARARLRRSAVEAVRALAAAAEAAGDATQAAHWARRACALDPLDEPAARRLIALLDATGDRAGALRAYDALVARLAREFDAEPSAETQRVVGAVRTREHPEAGTAVPAVPAARAVAVLPFANLSGTPDAAPFAAGLHDDLLTELSRIAALRVIARTSVLRYRDTDRPVPDIARELGVGSIVEGTVQSAGGRLRLNVQLVDAATGARRWAQRYDRELSAPRLFELQSELVASIAAALQAELTPAERRRPAREGTTDLDAYRLHAQGRAFLDQRTRAGMLHALDFFERAVARDPDYALAWSGLADATALQLDYGYEPAERVLPRAHEAVRRALAIDPDLAEAHTSLGEFEIVRRNGAAAVAALERAVALRGGYAEAHNWLSWMSLVLGDAPRALASARRAVELDPLAPEPTSNLALSLLVSGAPDEALHTARRTVALQPDWTTGRFYEGLALHHLDRFEDARAMLHGLTVEWAGSGPALTEALACVALGASARVDALLAAFERTDDPYAAGVVLLARSERARAFDALRRVRHWDYWPMLSLHHLYPRVLAPLRADPLHAELRRQMARAWGVAPALTAAPPALARAPATSSARRDRA